MCGIVGYHGNDEAAPKVFRGLKKLEYRGYDSAGIATAGNPTVKVEKGVGTIDEVTNGEMDGTAGIGHTRWATHGEVNETNAHPHLDCEGEIAVVHNGIIDNYAELKQELDGHKFRSETDTEVIPHLLEEEIEKNENLEDAARAVKQKIEGSYAVVATMDTGEMLAFREGSPLVMGVAGDEKFLASDVTPFLEHTDQAIFLEDGDTVVIDGEHRIYNSGTKVSRETEEVEWDAEEASKDGHEHFMEKEIGEQPSTVKKAAFQDESDLLEAKKLIEDAENVYMTGCGTSGFASSLGAKYLRDAGIKVSSEQSHELEYRADKIGKDDLVIALSQSGETADLLSMLDETEASLLALVNVVGSTLDRNADKTLYLNAGPEIAVASTKAFTAQVTVMKLLQYTLEGKLEPGRKSLLETAEKIEDTLERNETALEDMSENFLDHEHVYFIGRHKGVEIANEASLKLKEISYIHSESFPAGEFKHGTIALVEDGTPVVSFLKERGLEDIRSNTKEAESRGAEVYAVGNPEIDAFDNHIEIPEDENREILETVVFQRAAYLTAVKKGHNPDKPRNLAKSVTVK